MTATEILKQLYRHFNTQKYQINNQYIFNWESDFFCMTTSGYCVEVEVKISASDFKKDFEKDKHNLFLASYQGKKFVTRHLGSSSRGDFICEYQYGYLHDYLNDRYTSWYLRQMNRSQHWFYNTEIVHKKKRIYAPCTKIRIDEVAKTNMPNRFYFAVPAGFFVKHSQLLSFVPSYAGIIEVDTGCCRILKKAPMLHKNVMDLKGILLDKFYYKYNSMAIRLLGS